MPLLRRIQILCAIALSAIALVALPSCKDRTVKIEETPITIRDDTPGRGAPASQGDVVCIAYRIFLPDGKEFMHEDRFCFTLGEGAVIEGIDEVVLGMKAGGHRTAACPPHKHWGRNGYGDGAVPPNTTLVLEVSLREIQ